MKTKIAAIALIMAATVAFGHGSERNPSHRQETVVELLYGEKPFVGKSPFDLSVDLGVQK